MLQFRNKREPLSCYKDTHLQDSTNRLQKILPNLPANAQEAKHQHKETMLSEEVL